MAQVVQPIGWYGGLLKLHVLKQSIGSFVLHEVSPTYALQLLHETASTSNAELRQPGINDHVIPLPPVDSRTPNKMQSEQAKSKKEFILLV